ncbi:MAG: sigma-70 family RNA polymerase sigma factor [Verrucomicrobiota bacterium]|nr:sigma-70 family RNA polymerase sigma factor [Verrucomicrobiota bacterium]
MENNSAKAQWVRATVESYEGSLIRYAASITGDFERARDVVQDTFVRLCAETPSHLDGRLAEWLFTVCRNRALDMQRKEKRMIALNEMDLEKRESAEPSPSLAAEQKESAARILNLVAALPPNQSEVIRLKFQSDLSYEEISRVTSLSASNVGFLIHTGIKTLRQKIQSETKNELRRAL